MSDSVRPQRRQPTRLPRPWILQARVLEWGAIAFSKSLPDTLKIGVELGECLIKPGSLFQSDVSNKLDSRGMESWEAFALHGIKFWCKFLKIT